jgi:hypothetical protein
MVDIEALQVQILEAAKAATERLTTAESDHDTAGDIKKLSEAYATLIHAEKM